MQEMESQIKQTEENEFAVLTGRSLIEVKLVDVIKCK